MKIPWPWRKRSTLQSILEAPGGDGDLSPDAFELVVESWKLFLRAGGVLTPEAYGTLPAAVRGAIAVAGDKVALERACAIAKASSGPEGYAQVLAQVDDGLLLERMQVDQLAEEAVKDDLSRTRDLSGGRKK